MKFIQDADLEDLRKVYEVNFLGAVMLIDNILPIMIKQNKGHIVNLSSAADMIPGIKMSE